MKTLLEVALSQYGVKEIEGQKNNLTIVDYAHLSGFDWVNDDETPWCSISMNWFAMQAGLERTKKANARSWLDIGEVVFAPQLGDVVVFKRGTSQWTGHVGIFINFNDDGTLNVLGGNQSNQVKISAFPKRDLLGIRRLKPI